MVVRETCPAYGSPQYKKNGHTRHGKQQQCKTCGRQFAVNPLDWHIAPEQRLRIEQLLRKRLSLRGICRAVVVSLMWLLHLMVERLTASVDNVFSAYIV
jgi:hypothetical protein